MSNYVRRIADLPVKRIAAYGEEFALRNVVRPDIDGTDVVSINAITLPVTSGTPYHLHNNCVEAWVITRGEGILRVEDADYPFASGDVLYVPAGVPHQLTPTGDDALEYIAITAPAVDLENDNVVLEPFTPNGR
jgi:mannose-6-phosphate isomerase-like protein (cupin superfamily)